MLGCYAGLVTMARSESATPVAPPQAATASPRISAMKLHRAPPQICCAPEVEAAEAEPPSTGFVADNGFWEFSEVRPVGANAPACCR